MELAPHRPNVELRSDPERGTLVVLAFPYDPDVVAAVRAIPQRRFDWDTREWWAPADEWAGVHVADVLARFPELTATPEVEAWLRELRHRWAGRVTTRRWDGRGWFVLRTRAGEVPELLREGAADPGDGTLLTPLTKAAAEALMDNRGARLDDAAARCAAELGLDRTPPPARLIVARTVEGEHLELEVLWDPDVAGAFDRLPGAEGGGRLPVDPWVVEPLEAFLAEFGVAVDPLAVPTLDDLRDEFDEAQDQVRRSRAQAADPIPEVAAVLQGELQPFQWAGVRYLLEARNAFLADEQGLGKTVQALATLEADGAYPAVVVCPASLKLVWEREAARWMPHRTVAVVQGRGAVPRAADITVLNYELVEQHRGTLARREPQAIVIDESHLVKNPRAKRTQAVRRLAAAVPYGGLRLALTGTPVLNHADELVSQLRVIGRLDDFGSGARFAKRFGGALSEERLHWHLCRSCFVRRRKDEVLTQLPPKRRVVVPVALANTREYRLAEQDVIAWLRTLPLDLSELDARIAATLRAKRLAQLTALQRLAAKGKLAAALGWIEDFLASGEPLVVFARHREVQAAVLQHFPGAAHLLGSDPLPAREATVRAFQEPDGPQLLVAATRVAGQGLTLTRASNVCFLELEWTPALHDQAEDRCHRIGQRDAVTAWYLLAAESVDERMARLLEAKRDVIGVVTDGRRVGGTPLVEELARELRDAGERKHLRATG
ncbi:DEAD/DEAH box helicase [Conexibacter sp. SYSU D00693]|uniref:DEAD/DEAH box helicase n=1 Tax=Conexibacter sp. SYSU D00693 TaxID=2812560 RepID=UPI00196B23B0|nr:DEAD/DEAH box helicase [Conexibacter sp. SYSU D00693]